VGVLSAPDVCEMFCRGEEFENFLGTAHTKCRGLVELVFTCPAIWQARVDAFCPPDLGRYTSLCHSSHQHSSMSMFSLMDG
jgi:hypothetical protein